MIRYLFMLGLVGCTGDEGITVDDLMAPRGLPAEGSNVFSGPPECSDCFVMHTNRPYLSAWNFIPDGQGGARVWLQADGQGVSFEGQEDNILTYLVEIPISSSGELGDFTAAVGQIYLSGIWEANDKVLIGSNSVEVWADHAITWGHDTALIEYDDGMYGDGTIYQNSTTGGASTFDVNSSGSILWSGAHPTYLQELSTGETFGEYDPNLPSMAITLLDADHSVIYVNSLNSVPQNPSQVALADDNSAYFCLEESTLWDGTEASVSHPDFTTRGVFAKATPTGELDWFVPVSAIGNAGISLSSIVPDGNGGAWAVVGMRGYTDLNDLELNVEIGDQRFVAPTGRQLDIQFLIHIDSDGSVADIISPYPVNDLGSLTYISVTITNLATTPDGGVLAMGNVQTTQGSTGGTAYGDGGPVDIGGVLTEQTGTFITHVNADGVQWAKIAAAVGTNGFPGHISIDGDYAWILAQGYGRFSWNEQAEFPESTPPWSVALMKIKWQ